MIKQTTTLIFILGFSFATLASDFREVSWGMSKNEVKKIEVGLKVVEDKEGSLVYSETVAGKDVLLSYDFIDNKLYSGIYMFTKTHENENKYISDLTAINGILKQKYGNPKTGHNWSNKTFYKDIDRWGFAVTRGDVDFSFYWDNGETFIVNKLTGGNGKATHMVTFINTELEKEVVRRNIELQKNKF